jgi:hypothetical protein
MWRVQPDGVVTERGPQIGMRVGGWRWRWPRFTDAEKGKLTVFFWVHDVHRKEREEIQAV